MTEVSKFAGTKLAKGFKTDPEKEENGVWRVHADSGIHAKIRRASHPDYKRALRKHYKPFAHLTRIDPVQELLVKQKAAAEVLVADWAQTEETPDGEPVKNADDLFVRTPLVAASGEAIRPSIENVLAAFKEMPDFFEWVAAEADTFENYRVDAVETSAGNSSPSSSGSEPGEGPVPQPSSSEEASVASPSPSTSVNPI